jgi:hypothetical protein
VTSFHSLKAEGTKERDVTRLLYEIGTAERPDMTRGVVPGQRSGLEGAFYVRAGRT